MSDDQATAEGPYQSAVAPPPAGSTAFPHAEAGGGLLAVIERLATDSNLNIDVFERILAARRQEEDRAAERAFNGAMAAAKGELQPILKVHDVDYPSRREGAARTKYKFESFADVARAVDPVFARHALMYRFEVQQAGDVAKVTCIVAHAFGHSIRTTLEARVDPGATGMSLVQALGSTLTYLQRYSLRAAIGLAAAKDDDGKADSSPRITERQAAELRQIIADLGRSEVTMLRLVGVETIDDMNLDQWTRCKEVLDLARAEKGRAAGH